MGRFSSLYLSIAIPTFFVIFVLTIFTTIILNLLKDPPPSQPREAPIIIRLDLTPEAMRACAEAFARYGFWDVRDYECRVEKGSEGVVVALYGPGADGKAGELKRLGEVPLGRGK